MLDFIYVYKNVFFTLERNVLLNYYTANIATLDTCKTMLFLL